MKHIKPRQVTHRGHVLAAGFYFPAQTRNEDEAIARILTNWQPKARVYRFADGLLLLLDKPRRVFTAEAPGTPLVLESRLLTAAPLSEAEVLRLNALQGSVVIADGGALQVRQLSEASSEQPHQWIVTPGVQFLAGHSLGSEALKPLVVAQKEPLNLRQTLGSIPAASNEANEFLALFRAERPQKREFRLARIFSLITEFFKRKDPNAPADSKNTGRLKQTSPPAKLSLWFNSLAAQIAEISKLSEAIGWRQSRYLNKMMDLFERGDIEDALRHAIPLSSSVNAALQKISFGVPQPRSDLKINPQTRRASSSIGLSGNMHSHLQALYRNTVKRLEMQQRIEEAAFVLAELLQANTEAVYFLEKHGKYTQAAEIAEARGLPASVVVRLWFLAGDKKRAVTLARRSGEFAGAVMHLERSQHPAAAELRKLWAQSQAQSGHMATAADILWPLAAERHLAIQWMWAAVEIGGVPGAKCLARLIGFAGERETGDVSASQLSDAKSRALQLLRGLSVEGAAARLTFSETLYQQPKSAETLALARAACRASVRDGGLGILSLKPNHLRKLIDYSEDGALRADIPKLQPRQKTELDSLAECRHYVIAANERGAHRLTDGVLLENGVCAVALGEVGVRLLTRDGRTITHFDEPTDRMVVSSNGARLITMSNRGDAWRLSRIDMQTRRITRWCDAEITNGAAHFDGGTWFVVVGQDLYAIDADAKGFEAQWHIPDLGHFMGPLTLSSNEVKFVTLKDDSYWRWDYALPQLRLRSKEALPFRHTDAVRHVSLSAFGNKEALDCSGEKPPASNEIRFELESGTMNVALAAGEFVLGHPAIVPGWAAICAGSDSHTRILVYQLTKQPALKMEIRLEGKCYPRVRFHSSHLTVADDLGRLRAYELVYGDEIRSFGI